MHRPLNAVRCCILALAFLPAMDAARLVATATAGREVSSQQFADARAFAQYLGETGVNQPPAGLTLLEEPEGGAAFAAGSPNQIGSWKAKVEAAAGPLPGQLDTRSSYEVDFMRYSQSCCLGEGPSSGIWLDGR